MLRMDNILHVCFLRFTRAQQNTFIIWNRQTRKKNIATNAYQNIFQLIPPNFFFWFTLHCIERNFRIEILHTQYISFIFSSLHLHFSNENLNICAYSQLRWEKTKATKNISVTFDCFYTINCCILFVSFGFIYCLLVSIRYIFTTCSKCIVYHSFSFEFFDWNEQITILNMH